MGFVFQAFHILPYLTVEQNIALPLALNGAPNAKVLGRVAAMLEAVKLGDRGDSLPRELSGGEMQRVAIGRALVRRPAIYLMDEPLSSLDAKLRNDLRLELKRIQQDLGATLLYVTHDQIEAMTLATRIGVLEKGALVQVGTPQQIYQDPVSSYVAARLGSPRINLLPRAVTGRLPAPPAATTVGVRPDGTRLALANGHDSGHAQALVRRIEHLGDQTQVHVALGAAGADVELITLCSDLSGMEPGRAVSVEFTAPLYFDAAGQRITA
jgi:multiple sugar transport system ATP-binding protein